MEVPNTFYRNCLELSEASLVQSLSGGLTIKNKTMLKIEEFAKTSELFDGRYKMLRTLSTEGGSADVWLAIDQNTVDESSDASEIRTDGDSDDGILVAIKIYRPKNALDVEGERKFREEYKIVYNCHHANLLQPTNFSIFKDTPYLVLPYCRKGSSELLIGQGMSEDELWKYIHDVASGLAYLHNNIPPIIHQDIKPANVLMDDNGNYAITDFGISAQSGGKHEYYGDDNSGTFAYMAPERFSDNPVPMAASDIWGFGAALYEIITGHAPFGDDGGQVQPDGKVTLDYQGKDTPQSVRKMIAACLDKDPAKRPGAEEIEEAGRLRKFPVSRPLTMKIAAGAILCFAVSLSVWMLSPKEKVETMPPTPEETFNSCIHLMSSSNPDSLKAGIAKMDSLGNTGYIPALYELFFTYGWYSDSNSVKRKHLLGIDTYGSGQDKYLPKSYETNNKATSILTRIIESKDTLHPGIKAEATYRLAAYYLMTDKVYTRNNALARSLLQQSKEYAIKADCGDLLKKIEIALKSFEQ